MNLSLRDHRNDALDLAMLPQRRLIISDLHPSVDSGRYAVKRTVGDTLIVTATIFGDGHEAISADLDVQLPTNARWTSTALQPLGNDLWSAEIDLPEIGSWQYRVTAWLDGFANFVRGTERKREAGLPVLMEVEEGRLLIVKALSDAAPRFKRALEQILHGLHELSIEQQLALLLAPETAKLMRCAEKRRFLNHSYTQRVEVERRRASFASWYELFPRSQSGKPGHHGRFADVIAQLPRIKAMGFDVLYLPPIHPIGSTNRKGRNNTLGAQSGDPGSPYAIGSSLGGHDAIHPELGGWDDFYALVTAAKDHELELALDIAIQMSPDHPWLEEHPQWFKRNPDGTMKYAENPPKKYEDIVNPAFYSDRSFWEALLGIFTFWIERGVRIFRVDNPHTKPIPFWEWLIAQLRARHPDIILLAEAFTRPALMYHLAKIGFNESYTYFTWRNSKWDLTQYLLELSTSNVREYFRPHFFVNTPDINPWILQSGGRPAFLMRAALAATLSGLWGMYSGFEICEAEPLPGREEYRNSEKYELKQRNYDVPLSIAPQIAQLNMLRMRHPALQTHLGVRFYNAFNDNILYYGKSTVNRADRILVAVNLDPHNAQACEFEIPLWEWGLPDYESLRVDDLLHGHRFTWTGKIQHMRLAPEAPYAIWRVRPQGVD